jgi:NitT/TauT family transport system substrate-binding protein
VATQYYNQDPRLLRFVLSKPPDRVKYSNLRLAQKDFRTIADMAFDAGVLTRRMKFEEYADPRFSEHTSGATAYDWKGP